LDYRYLNGMLIVSSWLRGGESYRRNRYYYWTGLRSSKTVV